jgi:hypothetical protein
MRIRDIFFRNFWWKLASLVLATLIWINYVYPRGKIRILELPVVPLANNADVRNFRSDPSKVKVRLGGEGMGLTYLDEQHIQAEVILTDAVRTNGARLRVWVRGLPPGVSILDITPRDVRIYSLPDL